MTNNRKQTRQEGEVLQSSRDRLLARKNELNSFHILADELGVNVRYVYEFVVDGIVPKNREVQKAMGIYMPSRGAQIYRALNEKAQGAGWSSWSAYRRAILDGRVKVQGNG